MARLKKSFRGIPLKISVLRGVRRSILKFFPKRYKWLPFFAVLLQPKTKDKVFWVLWKTGTDGRTDNRWKVVIYIICIILHVYNITLWNVKLLVRGWVIEKYLQSPTLFHVKQYNVKQQPAIKKSTNPRWNSARKASKVATTQPTANGWRLEYLQNCNYAITQFWQPTNWMQ